MSHISSIDQVLRALRTQPLLEKAATRELSKSDGASNDKPKTARQAPAEAADYIVRQIRAIPDEDPHRRRRAFRIFLEGRLIDMLGKDALHSPASNNMLQQIQDAMSTHKDMARAMDGVADFLLTHSADPVALERLTKAFRRQ